MTGYASESPSDKTETLIRLGNLLFFPAGILLGVAYILHPPGPYLPELVSSSFWVLIHTSFYLSLLFGVFASFAALAQYLSKPKSRWLGIMGVVLSVIGLFMIGGLDYAEMFIFPTLAVEFPDVILKYGAGDTMPSVAFAFPAAGIFTVLGYLILGFELYRTRCVPAWVGILTIVSVVVFGMGLSGFFPFFMAQLGAGLFGLGLMSLGWGLRPKRTAS